MKHRVSIHALYYQIAERHEKQYRERNDLLENISNTIAYADEDQIEHQIREANDAYGQRESAGVIAITFAAMAIEAFFFDYAAEVLGDGYVKGHLDKIDLCSKFLVYLKVAYGLTPDKGGQAYQGLGILRSIRNEVVHFKSKAFGPGETRALGTHHEKMNDKISQGVDNSTATCRLVMDELDRLHGSGTLYRERLLALTP